MELVFSEIWNDTFQIDFESPIRHAIALFWFAVKFYNIHPRTLTLLKNVQIRFTPVLHETILQF